MVQLPRRIDPKVSDVPNEIGEKEFLGVYARNLKEYMSKNEFEERVRIVNRSGKKDAALGNVVMEVNKNVCDKLI